MCRPGCDRGACRGLVHSRPTHDPAQWHSARRLRRPLFRARQRLQSTRGAIRRPAGITGEVKTEELTKRIEALPARPGVYMFKDAKGDIIYVGKAKSLRARVRGHFNNDAPAPHN